jgi:hypothetical protein
MASDMTLDTEAAYNLIGRSVMGEYSAGQMKDRQWFVVLSLDKDVKS